MSRPHWLRATPTSPTARRQREFRTDVFYAVLAVLITIITLIVLQIVLILKHTPVHLEATRKAASSAHVPLYSLPKKP